MSEQRIICLCLYGRLLGVEREVGSTGYPSLVPPRGSGRGADPDGQKSPITLRNGTAVWEVTSGVLLRTKSRPWQVCKAEISEPLGQLMYVAVVYSKEQPLKRGLE